MATLPTVGGDYNTWGAEMNTYLQVGHQSDGTHFGTRVSKSNNTVYQALTDGEVNAWSNVGAGAINGYTDENADPTGTTIMSDYGADGKSRCVAFSVIKGDYWKVTGAATVNWLPTGTE